MFANAVLHKKLTGAEENGETKVNSLERGLLLLVDEEEVLRLEIPMHDAHGVADLDDADDDPGELGGLPLGVVAPLHDPVEELPAGAELHDEVHSDGVLVGALDADHVGVAGEVVHYLDLPADVLDVVVGDELPLEDGLARELPAGAALHAEVRGAELALPEPPAQAVLLLEVLRLALEHRADEQPRAGHALHLRRLGPRPWRLVGAGVLLGRGGGRLRLGGGDLHGLRSLALHRDRHVGRRRRLRPSGAAAIGAVGGGQRVAVMWRLPQHRGDGLEESVLGDAGADARVPHRRPDRTIESSSSGASPEQESTNGSRCDARTPRAPRRPQITLGTSRRAKGVKRKSRLVSV
jgi:hypothetical protein